MDGSSPQSLNASGGDEGLRWRLHGMKELFFGHVAEDDHVSVFSEPTCQPVLLDPDYR